MSFSKLYGKHHDVAKVGPYPTSPPVSDPHFALAFISSDRAIWTQTPDTDANKVPPHQKGMLPFVTEDLSMTTSRLPTKTEKQSV